MVQALRLLGIYALLPMTVVLSRYSLSMMVVGAMAIFTLEANTEADLLVQLKGLYTSVPRRSEGRTKNHPE